MTRGCCLKPLLIYWRNAHPPYLLGYHHCLNEIVSRASPFWFFFFSSRRRHTRCGRDWSSDVCSSDLVVIFYAHVATSPERLASLKPEVLAIFAGDDHGIGVDEVKKFEETLKAAGKSPKIVTYPSVGHSFFDETRPDYDGPLAKDAWVVTRDWLAATLKQAPVPNPAPPGR